MSHLALSIRKLSEAAILVEQGSDMLVELPRVPELAIKSASISIRDISGMLQKIVQELLVLQQVRDSELAQVCGED